MPYAILLCGVPGSGKTTVRDKLLKFPTFKHTSLHAPDDVVEQMAGAFDSTYREVYDTTFLKNYVYNQNSKNIMESAQLGEDMIIDRTHIDPVYRAKTIEQIVDFSGSSDYDVFCINVTPPPVAEWVARLDGRKDKIIPAETMFGFVRSFITPTVDEGFKEVWSTQSDKGARGDFFAWQIANYFQQYV